MSQRVRAGGSLKLDARLTSMTAFYHLPDIAIARPVAGLFVSSPASSVSSCFHGGLDSIDPDQWSADPLGNNTV